MRILAATPYYSPEGGGLERYAQGILSRLAARGHDVEAFAFTKGIPASSVQDGVKVQTLRPTFRAGNTPISLEFAARFRRSIAATRPDVVVAHTPVPFPAQAAAAAARKAKVPYVVTYHAGLLRGSSPLLNAAAALDRWTLERRMLGNAASLIAVSPYVRDHALHSHKAKTAIVPPGVDSDLFAPQGENARARSNRDSGGASASPRSNSILFVGALDNAYRWKGIDTLWDAFLQVRQRMPDASLRIVGEGDRFTEFQEKARNLATHSLAKGIPHTPVQLLGRLADHELPAAYRDSALTVLPSLTDAESFGMVLAEANACGRPVVASNIGGIPDFVRDGDNGRLAKARDPNDLADKILTVLEDEDEAKAMGERGRKRVVKEHDWDKLAVQTEGILQDAVKGRA